MPPSDTLQCSKCGYDLLGLPSKGECPECGQRYNMELRQGTTDPKYAQRDKFDWLLRRARTIILVVIALLVVSCGGVMQWLINSKLWGRTSGVALVVALLIIVAAVASYLSERD